MANDRDPLRVWLGEEPLSRPRAAASTIRARNRSRYAVFAPRARFFKIVRSAAVSVTGTARDSGMTAPRPNHSSMIRSRRGS